MYEKIYIYANSKTYIRYKSNKVYKNLYSKNYMVRKTKKTQMIELYTMCNHQKTKESVTHTTMILTSLPLCFCYTLMNWPFYQYIISFILSFLKILSLFCLTLIYSWALFLLIFMNYIIFSIFLCSLFVSLILTRISCTQN